MTIKHYATEAKTAHSHLMPLLSQAIDDTQARLATAAQAASADTIRPNLEGMLANADTPPAEAVNGILSGYLQLMPAHRAREGGLLIRSLVSTKKHHGLSDAQASQIAGAMLAAINGKGYSGIIEWPENWQADLSQSELNQWAEWVAPKEHAKLMASLETHTKTRISAESDLVQLKTSRNALAALVPAPSSGTVIKIRNNADKRQGVSGIHWEGGEVKEIAPADYARVTQNTGYQLLAESGQLEVLA